MLQISRTIAVLVLVAGVYSPLAGAQTLLVSEGSSQLGYGYGHSRWDNMTATLDGVFDTIDVVHDFEDLGEMLSHDRLWLGQRWTDGSLSGREIDNITAFAATGRRLVLMGENDSWAQWNNQILGIGGGSYRSEFEGLASPIVTHPLTVGITNVRVPLGGRANGGTELFDQNFATLWGPGDNMLTLLDINATDDDFWAEADNSQFARNVADWLAVPEPTTLMLLIVVGLLPRRRTLNPSR